jgi:hypothetical protein
MRSNPGYRCRSGGFHDRVCPAARREDIRIVAGPAAQRVVARAAGQDMAFASPVSVSAPELPVTFRMLLNLPAAPPPMPVAAPVDRFTATAVE